ncbi:MAG: hypothetical protein IPG98_00005 [Burkholderiales bacterium]|nr:hypothetical protein [Burkholderiales bacterium]
MQPTLGRRLDAGHRLEAGGLLPPGWFSIALGILVLMLMQTGALALMTLMLTGVVRGGTVTSRIGYQDFIEKLLPPSQATQRHARIGQPVRPLSD